MCRKYGISLVLSLLLAAVAAGCARQSEPQFALQLLAEGMNAAEAGRLPLERLPLREEMLITLQDIEAYDPLRHELRITAQAAGRLDALFVPMDGLPFVVTAGGKRIYAGAFWTPLSSLSYDGVAVMILPGMDSSNLRFELCYPAAPELFSGRDDRNHEEILAAFDAAGKLAETEELRP